MHNVYTCRVTLVSNEVLIRGTNRIIAKAKNLPAYENDSFDMIGLQTASFPIAAEDNLNKILRRPPTPEVSVLLAH